MPLSALKNSHLEQLNSKFFALLSTRLSILKIDHFIMRIGITFSASACGSFLYGNFAWLITF
ncbi:hypothetical protein CWC17_18665 [Pseudoalteromonas sp. S3785]|nr:hypothetical protein CWC17_18665 [Pseudoalteromonas sp. S3785]